MWHSPVTALTETSWVQSSAFYAGADLPAVSAGRHPFGSKARGPGPQPTAEMLPRKLLAYKRGGGGAWEGEYHPPPLPHPGQLTTSSSPL